MDLLTDRFWPAGGPSLANGSRLVLMGRSPLLTAGQFVQITRWRERHGGAPELARALMATTIPAASAAARVLRDRRRRGPGRLLQPCAVLFAVLDGPSPPP